MTTFLHSHPRARKRHVCEGCARSIEPGEIYTRGVGLDGGAGAWTYRYCTHCAVLIAYACDRLCADEYDPAELLEDWNPLNDAERAVKDAHDAQWRTGDGALLPVPVILREHPTVSYLMTGITMPEASAA